MWEFQGIFLLFVEIIEKVKGKAMKFAAKNVYLKKNEKMREESIKVEVMQAPVSNYSGAVSHLSSKHAISCVKGPWGYAPK